MGSGNFTRKFVLIAWSVVVIFLFSSGVYIIRFGYSMPDRLNESQKPNSRQLNQAMPARICPQAYMPEPVTILLMGFDEEGFRTDSIILMQYSPQKNRISGLSIPRDLYVKLNGMPKKVNEVYCRGGIKLVYRTVEKITGIQPDHYVTFDFKAFRELVNTLDGVEYNVPFNMNYDDPFQKLHIHLNKGPQLLDGDKAEQMVRYRKSNDGRRGYLDGDLGRIRMQQDFLKALIDQKLKLRYISKVDDIYGIFMKHVNSDIQLHDVEKYLSFLKDFSSDNVHMFSLPGIDKYVDDISYFLYDREETERIMNDYF